MNKLSNEARAAIFGSTGTLKRQWKGGFEPDPAWLKKPPEEGYAKEFCEGCNSHAEVNKDHVIRIFKLIDKDPAIIDWTVNFIQLNACDLCIESFPAGMMVTLALGKLEK